MYKKIYQILEETGKVKTAMFLNGSHKGEKCLIKEGSCVAFDSKAEDFWKEYEAELAACQDTKVVHIKENDFFVEIYVKLLYKEKELSKNEFEIRNYKIQYGGTEYGSD